MKDPQFHREMARRLRAEADDVEGNARFRSRELRARATEHERKAQESEALLDKGARAPEQ